MEVSKFSGDVRLIRAVSTKVPTVDSRGRFTLCRDGDVVENINLRSVFPLVQYHYAASEGLGMRVTETKNFFYRDLN